MRPWAFVAKDGRTDQAAVRVRVCVCVRVRVCVCTP